MRKNGETIALLYHATGVGKTVTAASDAKEVGGRTLFLVNALKLADQAENTFAKIWKGATLGKYTGSEKQLILKLFLQLYRVFQKTCLSFNQIHLIILLLMNVITQQQKPIRKFLAISRQNLYWV